MVDAVGMGDALRADAYDLIYVGGGQDREQMMVARDLAGKADSLLAAHGDGVAFLAVCGGYQLLGRGYRGFHGEDMPGVGLFPLNWEGPEIELAYHVVPSAWGRGYATEAAEALLAVAWEAGLDHVVAVAMPGNVASRRVMEKLGMSFQGSTRYRDFDVVRYSLERPG